MNRFIVSYSGGLGSFAAAVCAIKKHGNKAVELLFTDTKTEDEDLYRFLAETQKALDVRLTTIADGRNIWEVFRDVKFHGNSRIDPCSRVLKRELFRKHIEQNCQIDSTIIVFGIGSSESHRMTAIKQNWNPWQTWAPLIENQMTKEQILDLLDDYKIQPPRLYDLGFSHNNCGGFCVKTGQKQMKLLFEKLPERYAYHEQEQEKLFDALGKRHGFIKKTINGEMKYLTLKEFREMLERGEKAELYNQEGCGCFV